MPWRWYYFLSMPEIIKADGSTEPFDGSKLESSLLRAGAPRITATRVREIIENTLVPGSRTQDIYKRAFQLLRTDVRSVAARYSLRRALFEMGPSGHPFEDFVAEIFRKQGWTVEYRRMIQGKCVPHEVDVYATKNGEYLAAELKYHNDPGYKTDVKIALYVKSRLDDIRNCDPAKGVCPIDHGYLITNTKFTGQAIDYAKCAGVNLIGWTYPEKGNLEDMIMSTGVYPMTALTTLKKGEKRMLLNLGIVTTEQLKTKREVLRELSMTPERIGAIIAEIDALTNGTSEMES